jgi:predicted DNA-binding transcriptional regulator
VNLLKSKNTTLPKDIENTIIKILESSGNSGMNLSELQKILKIKEDKLKLVVARLSRKGIVKKEKIKKEDGKIDYKIQLSTIKPVELKIELSTVIKIPCFTCKYIKECGIGREWSPANCEILKNWLESETNKIEQASK